MSLTRADVIAWLERLTVSELDELILELQQRLHLQPIPKRQSIGMGAAPTMGMPLEPEEWSVELVAFGADKVAVIKAVRELNPTLGLMDAKKLVESAPVVLREGVWKDDAEAIAARLRGAGATVKVR